MEKQAKEEDSRVSVWLWRGMSCSVELVVPVALPYHGRPNCSLRPSRDVEPKTIGSWGKTLQWIPYHVRNSSSPQPYGRRFVVVCLLAMPFALPFGVAFWRCTQPNRGFFSSVSYFGLFNPRISGP